MVLEHNNMKSTLYQALLAANNNQLSTAKHLAEQVILNDPVNSDAFSLLGKISLQEGDSQASIQYFKKATHINPKSEHHIINYGIALHKNSMPEKAALIFSKFLRKHPNNLQVHIELATINLNLGKFKKAIINLKVAEKVFPTSPDVQSILGIALQYIEEFEAAENAYRKAISLGAINADTHSNLGSIYLRQNKLKIALLEFKKAIKINPNHSRSYRNIGHELTRTGQYDESLFYLEKTISLASNDVDSVCKLTHALSILGKRNESVAICEQALKTNPQHLALIIQYAFSLFVAGQYKESIMSCKRALTIKPGETSALAFLASGLNEMGNRKGASCYLDFKKLIKSVMIKPNQSFSSISKLNKALETSILNHPTLKEDKSNRSLNKGMCTLNLFDGNETTALDIFKTTIITMVNDYKLERPIDYKHPFLFSYPSNYKIECWANIMSTGGFHDSHFHPTSWLSGVYYPKLPKKISAVKNFSKEGYLEFGKPYSQLLSKDDPPTHLVQPKEGLMVLSPSYFGHRTIPFESVEKRISIAFDIIPIN